jgi:predicted DNA-binding transcriptional regulator YafY
MQDHHKVLTYAIENHLRVQFKYKSTDEDVATLRTVEPWIYGYKNNKESLLGCQVEPTVEIKRFDLRRVKNIDVLETPSEQHPDQIDLTKWDFVHARWLPHPEAA